MLDFSLFTVGDLKLLIYATTIETRIEGDLGKLFRSFLSALYFFILFEKGVIKMQGHNQVFQMIECVFDRFFSESVSSFYVQFN